MSVNRILTACCFLAALLCLARMLLVRGVVAPVRIDGSSMAESLQGRRYLVQCRDCGAPFACDPAHTPQDKGTVCFNCGYPENPLDAAVAVPGERVLLDQLAVRTHRVQRWDLVAFRLPGTADDLFVKRVVGLPGERIEIRDGDLFADGLIQRKSLDMLREMAILVNDDRYRPQLSRSLPQRWDSDATDSRWRPQENGYRAQSKADLYDWLTYRNWACAPDLAPPAARDAECPVYDNYSINQRLSRNSLNAVTDLVLRCRIQMTGTGRLALRLLDGRNQFQIEVAPLQKTAELFRDRQLVAAATLPTAAFQGPTPIEFAVCDQRVLLTIHHRLSIDHSFENTDRPFQPTSRPLAIGVTRLDVEVSDLQVLRDVHYLHPRGTDRLWGPAQALGVHEIMVLGDNAPVSVDSRVWNPPGLDVNLILGRVLRLRGQ